MSRINKNYQGKKHHLSEIYVKYRKDYLSDPLRKLRIEDKHLEAMRKAEVCRSLTLGAIYMKCETCGRGRYLYHTCKHRFCSGCGSANTYQWAEKTLSQLLEIPHHHIVMTLPRAYRGLSKLNGNKLHDMLFQSSTEVVQKFFKERYGCLPGVVSVLHTSGSDLKYHPHVHMIVSRGGKLLEGDGYKAIKGTFLVKNEVLGGMLKESFNKSLLKLNKEGGLKLPVRIRTGRGIGKWVESQKENHWIVNIEKPLKEVIQIVNYVGRYTKRACISEYKIESISPNIVFRSKDYKNSKRGEKALEILKVMTPTVFLDKLLQHVPEKRYRMVRYSGMYNSYYISKIPKELRAQVSKESIEKEEELGGGIELESMRSYLISKGYKDLLSCCYCNGQMKVVGIVNKEGELRTFDKNVP